MIKFFLLTFLFLISLHLFSQNQLLAFKKKKKILYSYSAGSYFAFMDNNQQWQYGIITKIRNDSFYFRNYLVRPSLAGMDTIHLEISSYALPDVYAMPKQGILIDDIDGPNNHQIARYAGHVHFYWIKSGWIFRVLGIGYAALNIFNAVVIANQPVSWVGLAIAAGVFAFGEILKLNYRPYWKLGMKYSLEIY